MLLHSNRPPEFLEHDADSRLDSVEQPEKKSGQEKNECLAVIADYSVMIVVSELTGLCAYSVK